MAPDSVQSLEQPPSGDPLSLFTHELKGSSPVPAPAKVPGVVSLDRVVDAAPLRFVEGIAVVQALCAAVKEKGGINAGMPDIRGVFLNEAGDVVAMTPPGAEPAAQELARLLHRLVPAESTPPVARLFVDRWTSATSTDLGTFASEIAYFARPNGRTLLTALHARCAGVSGTQAAPIATPAIIPIARVEETRSEEEEKSAQRKKRVSWLESHKRHVFVAVATVAIVVAATGLLTWFWPSRVAEAAQAATPTTSEATTNEAATSGKTGDVRLRSPRAKPLTTRPASQPTVARPGLRNSATPAAAPSLLTARSEQESIEPALAPQSPPNSAPTAALASRLLPDMRIYSAGDAGIEPPKLRSAEILESLIAGFPTKTNSVEVIVDKAGKVERVRMQGPPQRIPDIMLLSRVKEWVFEPATKDGMAVRYRVLLSWDVTP